MGPFVRIVPAATVFGGFGDAAFELLERLRMRPTVDQYHSEKEAVRREVQDPFRLYRDDLVVNFVVPSALNLETERNVFSRILKNDFGRGGAHHRLWMSFYRPGRTRLTDVQLIHALRPDGFVIGVCCPPRARDVNRRIQERVGEAAVLVADAISQAVGAGFVFSTRSDDRAHADAATAIRSSREWYVLRRFERDLVIRSGAGFVEVALDAVETVWPFYRLMNALSDDV